MQEAPLYREAKEKNTKAVELSYSARDTSDRRLLFREFLNTPRDQEWIQEEVTAYLDKRIQNVLPVDENVPVVRNENSVPASKESEQKQALGSEGGDIRRSKRVTRSTRWSVHHITK